MDQERLSILALHLIPGIGDVTVKQLISYCGSAGEVFNLKKEKLLKVPGIGSKTAELILAGGAFDEAESELRKAERDGTTILFYTDKAFPYRLKQYDDCPATIYLKGNLNLNVHKTVGIVGTRQATSYGKSIVETIVNELAPHQPLIISGLAYGIDIHAHKHSLKTGLSTIGVMGSGLDVIYPAAHRDVAREMTGCGGLVTEHRFGTKPDAHNFPARNRIIAALSDALIVVEAAEKGGALITADIANSYGKDVFAVPGALGQTFSEGCNKLIKTNRANLYSSVKDIEYIMNWEANGGKAPRKGLDTSIFDIDERKVLQVLLERETPMMIDEICLRTEISQGLLASLLLTLEFKNVITSLPGKLYRLNSR